jgi:aryl-alcohol dehydrogenase-like predicted oxidoreductase
MQYRKFGKSGLEVSEIGYGGWGIGGAMWQGATDAESIKALNQAVDLGVTFIDTALAYGKGHSEKLVGKIVRECKKQIYVATKIPPKNGEWPARPGVKLKEAFPFE